MGRAFASAHSPAASPVPVGRRSACLSVALLAVTACSRRRSQSPWDTGTVTLVVGEHGPDLAELVFEKNRLVRVDFKTEDVAARTRIQTRLDELQREAERVGLFIKFHADGGERGGLVGASPKPGQPHYARAIYQRFGDKDFRIQAK